MKIVHKITSAEELRDWYIEFGVYESEFRRLTAKQQEDEKLSKIEFLDTIFGEDESTTGWYLLYLRLETEHPVNISQLDINRIIGDADEAYLNGEGLDEYQIDEHDMEELE